VGIRPPLQVGVAVRRLLRLVPVQACPAFGADLERDAPLLCWVPDLYRRHGCERGEHAMRCVLGAAAQRPFTSRGMYGTA